MSEGQRFRTEGQSGLENGSASNVVVLVSSCDAYSDCWELFAWFFDRYWADCPFPIYLIANEQSFEHPRISTIQIGPDFGWSKNMRGVLERISAKYVLYLQEDYWLDRSVNTSFVVDCVRMMDTHGVHYVNLVSNVAPFPQRPFPGDPRVGYLASTDRYRTSLQAALWRKHVFCRLIDEDESIAHFETWGSARSRRYSDAFLSVYPSVTGCVQYVQAIVRGRWTRAVTRHVKRHDLQIDLSRRPVRSRFETWISRTRFDLPYHWLKLLRRDPAFVVRRGMTKFTNGWGS